MSNSVNYLLNNTQGKIMAARKRMELGKYIVSDPEICHGKLTFKGTRILVDGVLFYVAKGKDWDWISKEYLGRVNHEAIAEAIELAADALTEKTERQRRTEKERQAA